MIPVSTTQLKTLRFDRSNEGKSQTFRMESPKIGWIHTKSDQPGAKFDIVIKDALGRVRLKKENCGNDTDQYGELVNFETRLGEQLEVSIENVKGAERVDLFIN